MVRIQESTAGEIEVKVCVLGGEIKPVLLAEGATVEDALIASGCSTTCRVKCGGQEVQNSDIVEDGDRLIVASEVKGA